MNKKYFPVNHNEHLEVMINKLIHKLKYNESLC